MARDWSDELTVILGSVATVQEREEALADPIRAELLNRARERTQEMVRRVSADEKMSHGMREELQALTGSLYVLDERWGEIDEPERAALLSIARTATRRLATVYETKGGTDSRHVRAL
ncbi:MAG: hypothetical protein ACRDKB_13875 [Actinomycetota bacterium]